MTPNAYLLWFALIAVAGCFLTGRWVVRRISRWLDSHRWERSTADPDWSDVLDLIDEAEDIARRAAAGESWWL